MAWGVGEVSKTVGGGDASSLHREGPLGRVVTEIFKRSDEQLWIGLDSKGA